MFPRLANVPPNVCLVVYSYPVYDHTSSKRLYAEDIWDASSKIAESTRGSGDAGLVTENGLAMDWDTPNRRGSPGPCGASAFQRD